MTAELVGREAEIAAVSAFLDRVATGSAGLSIEGEPGIGKTTIWLEGVRSARARGYRVLLARPAEREQQLSFASLGDLLAEVMPDVEGGLPEPQRAALRSALLLDASAPTVDPRTTATGLVTALTALAAERPVVIAIDDAQWLDRASERAIEFAVRRLPRRTGVLLASRQAHEPLVDLGSALGPDAAARLQVGAIPDATLRQIVARTMPSLPASDIARIVAASGGNPFQAIEIAGAMDTRVDEGALAVPLPASLEAVVRERLDRLSDRARAAATAVACSFRPTRASVEAALGPQGDVDAALDEAERLGVLAWDGDRLRFSHPLLGAALYGDLSTTRRRALHRRLARAVDDPEEQAHHLVGSVVGPDAEAASRIELGAEAAERRGAVDAAAALYLAARDRTPSGDGETRARRALGAARASLTGGDMRAARNAAEDALATAAQSDVRARALLLLASVASYAGTIEERIAAHEAALVEAEGDAALRAQVLSVAAQITVDPWRALQQAREAVRLLRSANDPDRLAQACINEVMASGVLGLGVPADALRDALAHEPAMRARTIDVLVWLHWMDDVETRPRFERQVGLAQAEGDDLGAAELAEFAAMVDFRAGRWGAAEQLLEDACQKLDHLERRGPLTASFADRAVVDAHRGRIERARSTLATILQGEVPLDRFWAAVCLSALGAVEFVAGDHVAADRAWTAMRQAATAVGWLEFPEDRSEPDHIEVLLGLGEAERARELLAHLEWRGRTIPRLWIDAALPRARALVMAADGRLEEALTAIDDAPPAEALPFERARLSMVRGQLERRLNRRLAARQSFETARSTFRQLGSPPWIDRTEAEIDRLGLRHRDRHELTAMERRVAELAAMGLTNRQVADAAFVSPKTVEANLARVYGKLGIRSRAELGARMAPGGMPVEVTET